MHKHGFTFSEIIQSGYSLRKCLKWSPSHIS